MKTYKIILTRTARVQGYPDGEESYYEEAKSLKQAEKMAEKLQSRYAVNRIAYNWKIKAVEEL